MSNLSKEKLAQIKEMFDLFDNDKDTCITTDKVDVLCRGLGAYVSSEDIEDFIKQHQEGKVNFEQFEKFFAEYFTKTIDKKELLSAFEFLDKEKKGIIKADDLKHSLMVLGDTLTEKEANDLIGKFIDKNGNIDYKKFSNEIAK